MDLDRLIGLAAAQDSLQKMTGVLILVESALRMSEYEPLSRTFWSRMREATRLVNGLQEEMARSLLAAQHQPVTFEEGRKGE